MEELIGFIGCSVLLAVPALGLAFALRTNRRLRELESRLRSLEGSYRALARGHEAAEPAATSPAAAPRVAEPGPIPEPIPERVEPPQEPPANGEAEAAPGLEERLWTRLPVWIGAVAVVLAAAFLVKFSVDRGLLSPAVRVGLGVALGLALLAGGEWLRRSAAYLAQGLSAAGIAALFVAFYAAVNLYGLIPAAAGFLLMALTTAAAVALSLRQGVLVASLGLVGGFLTPALVGSREPEPVLLFSYLLLLQLGLLAAGRRRQWWGLAALTLVASFGWFLAYLGGPFEAQDSVWVGIFLVASVAAFLGASVAGGWGSAPAAAALGWGAMAGGLFVAGTLAAVATFGSLEWLFLGLLALGSLFLARWRSTYHGLAWLAAAMVMALLLAWATEVAAADRDRFYVTLGLFGVLFAGGAYAAHFGARWPGRWASLSAVVGVVYLLIAAGAGQGLGLEDFPWGGLALVLALLYGLSAMPVARRRQHEADGEVPLAALAVAATTLVSLAVPLELERAWLTVGWALEVPALVWLAGRLRVPALRRLAWVLLALVAVRLLLNPAVLTYPIGDRQIFNWLLFGYGVPALALLAARSLARGQGARKLAGALDGVALALVVWLVTLQVRQAFHPGRLDHGPLSNAESYAYSSVWIVLAFLLLSAGIVRRSRMLQYSSLAVMVPTIFKVFLYDVAHLRDLYRVFSFFGLGVSLFLLAFLYQRFIFRRRA